MSVPPHEGLELAGMGWRVGRSVGRTIYAQINEDPSKDDVLIGMMDTRELAACVVEDHNSTLGVLPGTGVG